MIDQARVSLRLALRSIAEAAELHEKSSHDNSVAQAELAVGMLYEFMRQIHFINRKTRRRYINGRYETGKQIGKCCRCVMPATKGVFCDEHHAEHKVKEDARRKKAK